MLSFILLTLFVVMSPGIDTALITKRTISEGAQTGIRLAIGIACGSLCHTLLATVGLSALIMQSSIGFTLLKFIGAFYLLYLGVKALFAKKQLPEYAVHMKTKYQSPFLEGLLSNVLNPKVAVFFLTFLPQFITSPEHATWQFLLMGITYAALSIIWFFLYVYFLQIMRTWLLSPTVQLWMERATGLVLIGFGMKLLFTKNTLTP